MAAIDERPKSAGQATTDAKEFDYAFTGPETLGGRYMRTFWQPVYVADRLEPGRSKPIRIMSEDFTLYRGEGGQAHVVAFRCAHRGTQLSTGWVEGDEIRCFYHGWKYDASGQCVEQPAETEPFCQRIKIRAYPTREYLGIIWAYLGEGEPPEFRRLPQFEPEDERTFRILRGGRVAPYNWANIMENDPAHVPFVHRDTQFFSGGDGVRLERDSPILQPPGIRPPRNAKRPHVRDTDPAGRWLDREPDLPGPCRR